MSQAIRRLRRFANPQKRQAFNSRRKNGEPFYNSVREQYKQFGEVDDAEVQALINERAAAELEEFMAPSAFEKALFLASDEPQAKKDRVDEFVPTPQPRFHLEISDLIKAEVNDATQQFRNTLYPTDWAKQKMSLIKPEDSEYQYWQTVLSDVNEQDDRAYEEDNQDLAETISDDYGDEEASSVRQELKSARNSSRQTFETKLGEVRSATEAVRRQVEQIAQQNIQRGGSKTLWESKIAQADYLSRYDARLLDLLNKAMPENLRRKVNTKTFELFKVDKNFVEQYKNYTRLINQKQHERQAAKEELERQYQDWVSRGLEKTKENEKYIQQHNDYVDWWNSKQDTMTMNEFFHTHPKVWAWVEWRLARHRLDFDKTDEQYAQELAHDYSYWPLPRNP